MLIVLLLIVNSVLLTEQTVFVTTSEDGYFEYCFDVVHDPGDDSFLISGQMSSGGGMYFWKISADGSPIWIKQVALGPDCFIGNLEYVGTGFIGAGYVHGDSHFGYIFEMDSDANNEWCQVLGSDSEDERFNSVVKVPDGIVAVGKCGDNVNPNVWLAKFNDTGDHNLIWSASIGMSGEQWGNALTRTNDGGFVFVGDTDEEVQSGSTNSILMVRTNSIGAKIWAKYIGTTSSADIGYSVSETASGDFIVSGETLEGVLLMKVSAGGSVLWSKKFGDSTSYLARSAFETSDGNIVLTGTLTTFMFIGKFTSEGEKIWGMTVGRPNGEGFKVIETVDDGGGYLAVGNSGGWSTCDALAFKVGSGGEVCEDCEVVSMDCSYSGVSYDVVDAGLTATDSDAVWSPMVPEEITSCDAEWVSGTTMTGTTTSRCQDTINDDTDDDTDDDDTDDDISDDCGFALKMSILRFIL